MSNRRKPLPKSQGELSQETINPLLNQGKAPLPDSKKRENQRRRDKDDVKDFTVGLSDIDTAIIYYFDNVIRPSVIQNAVRIPVPFIYGSPERWAAVQKDGFYRDKNGKIQAPLIMFKRDSVEKNRSLGNKMDANNPIHFGIFEKKYSPKNVYDRFSALANREPVKEYFGVIIPDYVNIVYTCIIFTEYVEQMNKIVESINFASDAYWGDAQRFKFRASIDNYTTAVELTQGQDRVVKTTFQIKLAGYIISDAINANIGNSNKFFSKAAVKFKIETAGNIETLNARSTTPESKAPVRFFDTALTGAGSQGMTPEQINFVGISNTALADSVSGLVAVFNNHTILTPPPGFTITQESFQVYVNGVLIATQNRTVQQVGANIEVTFSNLDYNIDSQDQIVLVGKFS
jgi:hypothetical protein